MANHTKYKKEFADQLPQMFAEGQSVAEVIAKLGIARQTFYTWVDKHEAFSEAYALGQDLAEAWWSELGREGAAGTREINPTVWIFNMKNKFGWKDKKEHAVTGSLASFLEGLDGQDTGLPNGDGRESS